LVHKDITEKNHSVMQGYKDGMAKCGLQYDARLEFDTQNTSAAIIAATIAGFYKKNNFDALLLDPILTFRMRRMHLFNNSIGLPEKIKIVTVGSVSYIQTASQSISSMEFPYEEIGRTAAMRLIDDDFRSGQQTFTAKIFKHESTMHEIEKSVLAT
jgi:DNA-binding LacI/PurR family transcriptional regulator